MNLFKFADVLVFKKFWNLHHKTTPIGKKRKKNLQIWINWNTLKIIFSFFTGTNVYKKDQI